MVKNGLLIKEEFEYADLIIPTLLTKVPNYSQDKLTSKLLNFQNLSNLFNSSFIPPAQSQRVYDFSISNNLDYCVDNDND
ncbi:3568_t:CDS:2 [Gigaspora margarita]|uniref:3568_t:CDS:1 n=1 Tax=Gigaspora margarita TaxID=4874 RepID=A0ABN7UKM0_GIGMA|nr:3568_t:CDS:2 [Gigaspora margarita]